MNIIDKIDDKFRNFKDNNPEYLVVHHSAASPYQTFESIKSYHINQRNFETIGYQYLITYDGIIYQGRPDLMHGAHVKEQHINKRSIGICMVGDFDKEMPTELQIKSVKELLNLKMKKYNISKDKIVPHRYFLGNPPYKTCCGKLLSETWLRNLVDDAEKPKEEISENQFQTLVALLKKWLGLK